MTHCNTPGSEKKPSLGTLLTAAADRIPAVLSALLQGKPKLVLAACLFLTCACAASGPVCPEPEDSQTVCCPEQWNESGAGYTLRHAGTLAFPGEKIPVEGIMRLDLKEKKARISVWTMFGAELFTLTVSEDQTEADYIQSGLKSVPGFASKAGRSIRRSFFAPNKDPDCYRQGNRTVGCLRTDQTAVEYTFSPEGLLLQKAPPGPSPEWSVAFKQYVAYAGEDIPEHVEYTADDFRVSLKLKEVKRLCPAK
ncbi:MAG: hypothetical protein ACLFSY_11140 [Desulfonatronovibrionaceae bacterium]